MIKYKRITGVLLIMLFLLSGIVGTAHATNNTDVDNTTITTEEIADKPIDNDKSNSESDADSAEPRNGDLTKDSKYPFYDEAGVLSEETKNIILNINKNFENEGAQVGVVILKSLNGSSAEERANSIFNTWGLGSKERNNGALLLISIADRKFRLEVGDGLRDTVLSDYDAKEIIDKMVPYFKKEAYNLGINVALFEIDQKFYSYRSYLAEHPEEQKSGLSAGTAHLIDADKSPDDIKTNDGSNPSSEYPLNLSAFHSFVVIALAIMLIIAPLVAIYNFASEAAKRRQEEKEEQERINLYGPEHSFEVEVVDQFGTEETYRYSDYSKKRVDKKSILDRIEHWINYGYFGRNVTGYSIDTMSHNIDNAKCQDIDTLKIKIKTEGQEEAFANDEDRVKLTQDFYNKLSIEEQSYYRSRANASMEHCYGTNFWFYMYLYTLLNSERKSEFNGLMRASNMSGDGFYEPPRSHSYSSYSSSSSSSSNSSSFGSDFGGGFGGFGGGMSSGGGASGGW